MTNTMTDLQRVSICWDGAPDRALLDDAMALNTQAGSTGELHGHFVFTSKTSTLAEQVSLLGAAAGIQPLIEKEPMLAIVMAATLLAAISPIDLYILDNFTGSTLEVIKKLSRRNIVDVEKVKALVKIESVAEQAIQKLVDFGILRLADNGDLIIQRRIISNIRVSL